MVPPEGSHAAFSTNATRVLNRATDTARGLANALVEPEAILLTILQLPSCNATDTLRRLGINALELAYRLEGLLFERATSSAGTITYGPRAQAMLDRAFQASQQQDETRITTLHLLLAIIQDRTDPLGSWWDELGLTEERLLDEWYAQPDGDELTDDDEAENEAPEQNQNQPPDVRAGQGERRTMDSGQLFYNYFSFSAKKAIYRASEICQQFSNQFVEPEHILFSILQLRSCSAVQVLQRLNVNLPKLTYSIEAALYERAGQFKGNNAFSARALALLDASFREVKKLNHREIGTTHLLIALASARSPALRELFDEHRLDAKRIRDTFLQHLRGYGSGGREERDDEEGHGAQGPGWPPGVHDTITVGGVPFTPGRTFHKHALQVLAGAAQLAAAYRQPETTPAELLAAMVLGAAGPLKSIRLVLELDTVALQARLAEHWQAHALPQGEALAEPPLSGTLADLFGRAVALMIREAGTGAARLVNPEHLLLALLDETTEPISGFLQQQDDAFTAKLTQWKQQRQQRIEKHAQAQREAAERKAAPPAARDEFRILEQSAELSPHDPEHVFVESELGIEKIDLRQTPIELAVAHLIPARMSATLGVLPFRLDGTELALAMIHPLNITMIDAVRQLTGREVRPYLTTAEDLEWAQGVVYGQA